MSWAKLDDTMGEHRKIQRALRQSRPAIALHFLAILHCARYLTDGYVETRFVDDTLTKRERAPAIAALVDHGLWHATDNGYLIHDYLAYNPSREKIQAQRAIDAKRKRGGRRDAGRSPHGIQADSAQSPDGVRPESDRPDPTRPVTTTAGDSPKSCGRARATGRTLPPAVDDDERRQLAAYASSVLQGAVDSLTCDERGRDPTPSAVLDVLGGASERQAHDAAWEARSIAQSQNRAPNIVALFAQRLSEGAPL